MNDLPLPHNTHSHAYTIYFYLSLPKHAHNIAFHFCYLSIIASMSCSLDESEMYKSELALCLQPVLS